MQTTSGNGTVTFLANLPDTIGQVTLNGREMWLYSDGTMLPVIRGGDGDDPPKDPPDPKDDGKEDPKKDTTFTQEELNRIAAREKDEGKRAALADVAKTLGCTVEEAASIIKTAREADDKQKSEAQRSQEAADKAKAEADAEKAEAAKEKHTARVERVLLKAGVMDEKLEKVARMLDAEVGAEVDKIEAAAKDLKKEFPELFTGKPAGGPPNSDPPGGPPKPTLKDDKFNAGVERAKQYSVSTFGAKESK
jgi:hypothetical protein